MISTGQYCSARAEDRPDVGSGLPEGFELRHQRDDSVDVGRHRLEDQRAQPLQHDQDGDDPQPVEDAEDGARHDDHGHTQPRRLIMPVAPPT